MSETFRKIIDAEEIASIIDLPEVLRNRKLELVISPAEPPAARMRKSLKGALHQYANPALIELEEGAWARSVQDDYT